MSNLKSIALSLALGASLTGCGAMQAYNQGLDAKQQAFERQQKVLDEQNNIELNNLKAQQRTQEIQAARAEGQKSQAQAAGEAQATIEKAKGDAEATIVNAQGQAKANELLARSLTPLIIKQHFIDAIGDKTVIYLPSTALLNLGSTIGKDEDNK